jgi:hypothetical protein
VKGGEYEGKRSPFIIIIIEIFGRLSSEKRIERELDMTCANRQTGIPSSYEMEKISEYSKNLTNSDNKILKQNLVSN